MTTPSKKRLALSIIDFINKSAADGTIDAEDKDSAEIAAQCIRDIFKVDPDDEAAMADALGGQNLLSIYSVYEKLKGKSTASTSGPSSAEEGRPATPQAPPAGKTKEDAEALKAQGNAAMQKKDHVAAAEFYTKALEIVPLNPIYLSNRAAAYSGMSRHELAKNDAEMAVAADPKYTKAWSRLGLAKYALGDAKGAMEAYKSGIDAEGNGGSEAMKKGYATAKQKVEEETGEPAEDIGEATRSASPDAGAPGGMPDLASMLGGGGGGMPDIGSLMQNPMMRQMAQSLMSNPDMMSNLMNNPRLRELAGQFGGGRGGGGGGGGMPDIASLMQDPSIADMARNFMGGGGAGGGAPGAGRGGSQ